jgi:cytochrome c oxidase subunit 2
MPGQTYNLWLQASQPGTYLGMCAEFCGLEHAKMDFLVIAESSEQFTAWLSAQQKPAIAPNDPLRIKGEQTLLGSACVYCHTIKGTNATGKIGPDLTHVASRQMLGAGAIENNRGNLAGWIIDAQGIKPGNQMPPMHMEVDQLQALLAYLEGLK